jgi:hypothetical protein
MPRSRRQRREGLLGTVPEASADLENMFDMQLKQLTNKKKIKMKGTLSQELHMR